VSLRLPAILVALVALLAAPGAAGAQQDSLVPEARPAPSPTTVPPGFSLSPRDAVAVADAVAAVRRVRRTHPGVRPSVAIPTYLGPRPRWEVGYARPGGSRLVEVHVDGRSGRVMETWTGPQVDSLMARGYEPSVGGRLLNAPYVWLPLCLVFLVPFLDPRRPLRLLHLDLLMLLGFGLSQLFLNRGQIELSVPLAYPFLAYLLARLLLAGFRPRPRSGPIVPIVPMRVLAVGLLLLVCFRVALNVTDSSVIDVGYASVVGADRIEHREQLYTDNDVHGDAYGPVNYLAYIPFELVLPTSGSWDSVPAAHAASLTFDLLTILGLFLLGASLRGGREGRGLGLALAFAWAAYPYTTYVLQSNTNDGLVAMLLVYALLALRSPAARGGLLALGTAAKFIPLALAPLFALGVGERRPRSLAAYCGVLAAVLAVAVLAYLPDGGIRELYNATVGYQLGRTSPFSLWGLHPSLSVVQALLEGAAVALALVVAVRPRRRDARQVAALGAAVLIAAEIAATHWFYFYLVWFAPFALVAMLGAYRAPEAPGAPERARGRVPALAGSRSVSGVTASTPSRSLASSPAAVNRSW